MDAVQLAKGDGPRFDQAKFTGAAKHIHERQEFTPQMMQDEPVKALTRETYTALSAAINIGREVPPELRVALEENTFIFSGFKTYQQLREVSGLLKDEDGGFKSFEAFSRDIQQLNDRYNKNYLRAEYNYATQSTQMAVKWHDFVADGDDYLLQYRTSGDDRVRAEHAALHGVTLPIGDAFWDEYMPPLDWGCRCTVVQVLREKYQQSDPDEAKALGEAATASPKKKIFRFNPGKTMKIFPPKHPYYKASKSAQRNTTEATSKEFAHIQECELKEWYGKNLPKTPQGNRFDVEMSDGKHIFVRKKFYNECISKYKDDELYVTRLLYARRAHIMLQKSTYIGPEPSRDHPDATFSVYQYNGDSKYRVEFKVLCNADGMFLYYMRLYKK